MATISPKGYRMVCIGHAKKALEHRLIWERAHGPIPDGHCLHHINGDKLDNRLENLQLMKWGEHSRFKGKWALSEDGRRIAKVCRVCEGVKPLDEFYVSTSDHYRDCKTCTREKSRKYRATHKAECASYDKQYRADIKAGRRTPEKRHLRLLSAGYAAGKLEVAK